MTVSLTKHLKIFAAFALAFTIGYAFAVFVHEGGHFLAGWLQQDQGVTGWETHFDLLGVSYVLIHGYDQLSHAGQAMIHIAGMLAGTLWALVLGILCWAIRPIGLTGLILAQSLACSAMLNGLYLAMSLGEGWGDAKQLLFLHLPAWSMAIASLPLLIAWLWAQILACQAIFSNKDPIRLGHALAALAGTSLFPALIVFWQRFVSAYESAVPFGVFVTYAVLVGCVAALALFFTWKRANHQGLKPKRKPMQALAIASLFTAAFLLPLLAGGYQLQALLSFGKTHHTALQNLRSSVLGLTDEILPQATDKNGHYRPEWNEERATSVFLQRAKALVQECEGKTGPLPEEIAEKIHTLVEYEKGLLLLKIWVNQPEPAP